MERARSRKRYARGAAPDRVFYDNQNPMLNHVILRILFGLIPFKLEEFKNFRLVSRVWNDCAVTFVHQNAWLKLDILNQTMFQNLHGDGEGSWIRSPLLELISRCSEDYPDQLDPNPLLQGTLHSFKKFLLSKQRVWDVYQPPDVNSLWQTCGPLMTHLDISDSYINSNDFRRIIFEFTPNLQVFIFKKCNFRADASTSAIAPRGLVWDDRFRPQQSTINKNLTHLTIMCDDTLDHGFPINWIEFACYFPNLKNMKLGLHAWRNKVAIRSLEKFLRAVILVRQNCGQHYLAQLEHLDILENPCNISLDRLPRTVLLLLRQLAFPLATLALDIGDTHYRVDRLALKNTLELHSSSLQNLTLHRGYYQHPFSSSFRLPNLTKLILIGHIPKNLYFLKHLPMLKVFVLLHEHSSVDVLNMKQEWSTMYSGLKIGFGYASYIPLPFHVIENTDFSLRKLRGVVLPNLETFIVGTELCKWKQIRNLAKLMPNIKTLQLGTGNGGFRMVCKYWSQLEHMHVEPMDVTEFGIFGVQNGERYRLPNITDLKSLKTISLGYSSEQRRVLRLRHTLEDADVTAAVLLPNLEAAFYGTDIEVFRKPVIVASSRDTLWSGSDDDSD
ncbi:unnamed protein product [Orchesella dallaii]|uniref:F-box domain-containing protein n=1 Tax=Orchesella dallaii TaxID=48710 RepID=A0ABP1RU67_9HEXA